MGTGQLAAWSAVLAADANGAPGVQPCGLCTGPPCTPTAAALVAVVAPAPSMPSPPTSAEDEGDVACGTGYPLKPELGACPPWPGGVLSW